jgi:hypothetical protein
MVQRVLKDSGFDFGSINGILGPETRAAKKYIQIKKRRFILKTNRPKPKEEEEGFFKNYHS